MNIDDLPPILLGYSPRGAELRKEVVEPFGDVLHRIENGIGGATIPWLKEKDGVYSGKVRGRDEVIVLNDETLADYEKRKTISQMAIGEFWEMMNVADLLFHWSREKAKPKLFKVSTTHYNAEFWNSSHAITFMFDMEGRWTDWLKGYEKWQEWLEKIKNGTS